MSVTTQDWGGPVIPSIVDVQFMLSSRLWVRGKKPPFSVRRISVRIARRDDDGIRVATSYSLNRALVLESHQDDDPTDVNREWDGSSCGPFCLEDACPS